MSDGSLAEVLRTLRPTLKEEKFVFVSVPVERTSESLSWIPLSTMLEPEGLSLVLEKQVAERHNLPYEGVFKLITLQVVTDLQLVGLTAVIAGELAREEIPANVIAGCYHDHILVPADRAERAISILRQIAGIRD